MLKALQTRKKLKDANEALDAVRAKRADLQTREAELEIAIEEAKPEDEATIDNAIDELEKDKAENDAEEQRLQGIIDELEKEIESEPKPRQETPKTDETRERGNEMEIRETKEYLHAWVEAVKKGDEREVRSLITENTTNGTIPVPTYVEGRVRTAWESDGFVSRIAKTFVKGNLTIMYEVSSSDAVIHGEGSATPQEEALVLGKVTLVPATIKKWIGVSDEALSLTDEAFVDYIFDELTYRIIKRFRDKAITDIGSSTLVPKPTGATSVAQAVLLGLGALSDEATDPVVIMSKQAWAQAKMDALNAGYAIDPFAGLEVLFNDQLARVEGGHPETIIVGDLKGYHANFPNGQTVRVVADEKAKEDMVEFVGKLLVGQGVVAPDMIALVAVASN